MPRGCRLVLRQQTPPLPAGPPARACNISGPRAGAPAFHIPSVAFIAGNRRYLTGPCGTKWCIVERAPTRPRIFTGPSKNVSDRVQQAQVKAFCV